MRGGDAREAVGEHSPDRDRMPGWRKLVELVKKYAAPMYEPTAAGAKWPRPDRANEEDDEDQCRRGDHFAHEVRSASPVVRRKADGTVREHHVCKNGATETAEDLCAKCTSSDVSPADVAKERVDQRDTGLKCAPETGMNTKINT